MRSRTRTVSMYGAIVFALVIGLFPIWWMIVTSFKQPVDIYSGVSLVPQHFTMDNYAELFQDRHFGSYLGNSLVVVALSVGISLAVGTLGAYALTRSRIGELMRRLSLVGALVVRMVPPILLAIPVYIVLGKLGLLDTKLGLIFVYAGLNASLVVWMMESYLGEIPPEIEEARPGGGGRPRVPHAHLRDPDPAGSVHLSDLAVQQKLAQARGGGARAAARRARRRVLGRRARPGLGSCPGSDGGAATPHGHVADLGGQGRRAERHAGPQQHAGHDVRQPMPVQVHARESHHEREQHGEGLPLPPARSRGHEHEHQRDRRGGGGHRVAGGERVARGGHELVGWAAAVEEGLDPGQEHLGRDPGEYPRPEGPPPSAEGQRP